MSRDIICLAVFYPLAGYCSAFGLMSNTTGLLQRAALFNVRNRVDYYSSYFEVNKIWGICEILITDNGPCFSSPVFATFARKWEFHHRTQSSNHPQSNGLTKKYVQICERMLYVDLCQGSKD